METAKNHGSIWQEKDEVGGPELPGEKTYHHSTVIKIAYPWLGKDQPISGKEAQKQTCT